MELTGLDQLWRADITYIRLETEFVYLAVVLDAYSRRVIGWALDRSLEDDLAIAALQMAFRRRAPGEGLTPAQCAATPQYVAVVFASKECSRSGSARTQ